jgi:hypothetical protein
MDKKGTDLFCRVSSFQKEIHNPRLRVNKELFENYETMARVGLSVRSSTDHKSSTSHTNMLSNKGDNVAYDRKVEFKSILRFGLAFKDADFLKEMIMMGYDPKKL